MIKISNMNIIIDRILKIILLVIMAITISGCDGTPECYSFSGDSLDNSSELVSLSKSDYKEANITATRSRAPGYEIAHDMNLSVSENRLVRIRIAQGGAYEDTRKYRVMVRADPRFTKPQIFIAEFKDGSYVPDWYSYSFSRYSHLQYGANLLNEYHEDDREARLIDINPGDVVNFRLLSKEDFYKDFINIRDDRVASSFMSDSSAILSPVSQNTSTGRVDNALVYTSDKNFVCSYNIADCGNFDTLLSYLWVGQSFFGAIGNPVNHSVEPGARACNDEITSNCIYRDGDGLGILVEGAEYKPLRNSFLPVKLNDGQPLSYTYYIFSGNKGKLDFSLISDGASILAKESSPTDVRSLLLTDTITDFKDPTESQANFINRLKFSDLFTDFRQYNISNFIFGRYLLDLEIGSATGLDKINKIKSVKIGYVILDGDQVVGSGDISNVSGVYEFNAPASGRLHIVLNNPYPEIKGSFVISAQSYNGSAAISTFLYDMVTRPIKDQFTDTTATMFSAMSSTGNFAFFIKSLITLYLLIQGILFATGSIQVTAKDLTVKIIKLAIVSALLTDSAFAFFHKYLFSYFILGTDQLLNSVTNATSAAGNPFGFMDPMIEKYFLNGSLWFILWNYVLFFGYGYILPAIIIMIGIFYFLWALGNIFVGYLMAFVCLCVLIALGPIFICFILFDYTRNYFDNWINVMFGYVIQPTIVLILLLFIDQIMSDVLEKGLLEVCHHCFLEITLNLPIPFGFVFEPIRHDPIRLIPFCIYGYAPHPVGTPVIFILRNSVLFFLLTRLLMKISSISSLISDMLTSGGSGGVTGPVSGGGGTMSLKEFASGLSMTTKPLRSFGAYVAPNAARKIEGARREFQDFRRDFFKRKILKIDHGESILKAMEKDARNELEAKQKADQLAAEEKAKSDLDSKKTKDSKPDDGKKTADDKSKDTTKASTASSESLTSSSSAKTPSRGVDESGNEGGAAPASGANASRTSTTSGGSSSASSESLTSSSSAKTPSGGDDEGGNEGGAAPASGASDSRTSTTSGGSSSSTSPGIGKPSSSRAGADTTTTSSPTSSDPSSTRSGRTATHELRSSTTTSPSSSAAGNSLGNTSTVERSSSSTTPSIDSRLGAGNSAPTTDRGSTERTGVIDRPHDSSPTDAHEDLDRDVPGDDETSEGEE